ncbi:MAG: MinD/ParA family protein [Phycisphaerales bacterium]
MSAADTSHSSSSPSTAGIGESGGETNGRHDQASALRRMMRVAEGAATSDQRATVARSGSISVGPALRAPRTRRVRLAHAIAVMSGKGGVGKTNLSVNLAIAMAQLRVGASAGASGLPRVCLLDADLGLANADVLCGLAPRATLEEVLHGARSLEDVMVTAPGGFRLMPGASGVASVANLGAANRRRLILELASLERSADVLLIDTAAGIAANTMAFAIAAHTVLVAVTPEPTSITDAYGAIKTLVGKVRAPEIKLIVNMANDRAEGDEVFRRIDRVSRSFLGTSLKLAGVVPFDPAVRAAVRRREPVLIGAPDAPASRAIRAIARELMSVGVDAPIHDEGASAFGGARSGFLARLGGWLARRS